MRLINLKNLLNKKTNKQTNKQKTYKKEEKPLIFKNTNRLLKGS